MNLLLDTRVFLWAVDDSPNLSPLAREAIVDGHNAVFVSAATAWEISIKRAIGKIKTPKATILRNLDFTASRRLASQLNTHWQLRIYRLITRTHLTEC